VVDDVLGMLEAQGEIYTYGDLVFLQPAFVTEVIKPLVDHDLMSRLKRNDYKQKMREYIRKKSGPKDPNDFNILWKALENLVTTGEYEEEIVAPFLWDDGPLDPKDYDEVNQMLRDIGVVFKSLSLDALGRQTLKYFVLYRLSASPNDKLLEEAFPKDCPPDMVEKEMRVDLPIGCPQTLAAQFAASFHKKGRCTYAWLLGAIIVMKNSKNKIRAALVEEKEDDEEGNVVSKKYFQVIVRTSKDEPLSKYVEKETLEEMAQFMKEERTLRFPGLFYTIVAACPECNHATIELEDEDRELLEDPDKKKNENKDRSDLERGKKRPSYFCKKCGNDLFTLLRPPRNTGLKNWQKDLI